MNNADRSKQIYRAVLAVSLVMLWCAGAARADSKAITPADIKFSEPFEIHANIMEVDYGKNLLFVAEYEIHVVDLLIGAEAVQTELSDADGNTLALDAFERGRSVRVSGLKLSDGRVIAEELVLQPDHK